MVLLLSLEGLLLSHLIVQELLLDVDDAGKVDWQLLHKFLHTTFVCKSFLEEYLVFVCQGDALRVLGHEENFPATGKNSNDVGIWVSLSSSSHVVFCTKKFVEAFCFVMLVYKNDLTAILDHAMARIAEKGKDDLMGVTFEQATKFWSHVAAVYDPWL